MARPDLVTLSAPSDNRPLSEGMEHTQAGPHVLVCQVAAHRPSPYASGLGSQAAAESLAAVRVRPRVLTRTPDPGPPDVDNEQFST